MSVEKPSVQRVPEGRLNKRPLDEGDFEGVLEKRHPGVDFEDALRSISDKAESLENERKEILFRYGDEAKGAYNLMIGHLRLIEEYWKLCAGLSKQAGDERQNTWEKISELYSKIRGGQEKYRGLKEIRAQYLLKKRKAEEAESRRGESEHLAELSRQLEDAGGSDVDLDKGWSVAHNIEWNMEHALEEEEHQRGVVERLKREKEEFFDNYTPGADGGFYDFAIKFHEGLAERYHLLYLSHQAVLDQDKGEWRDYRDQAEDILDELRGQEPEYYSKKRTMEEIRKNPQYESLIAKTKETGHDYFS